MASSAPDWRADVLRRLGAPVTAANLQFLADWQRHEGGHTNNSAHWNWLNTTSGSQYPTINSVGVRSFPNYVTGVTYTAATISNGRYQNVVRGLKSGNPYNSTLREGLLGDLSTWVSGSRSGGLAYAASVLGAPDKTGSGQPAQTGGGSIPKLGTAPTASAGIGGGVGTVAGWVYDESKREWRWVGQGAAAGGKLFGWIPGVGSILGGVSSFGSAGGPLGVGGLGLDWVKANWDRVLEVVGGFVFLLIGIILLGKAVVGNKMPAAAAVGAAVGSYQGEREYAAAGRPGPARKENLRRGRSIDVSNEGDRAAARAARPASAGQTDEIPF